MSCVAQVTFLYGRLRLQRRRLGGANAASSCEMDRIWRMLPKVAVLILAGPEPSLDSVLQRTSSCELRAQVRLGGQGRRRRIKPTYSARSRRRVRRMVATVIHTGQVVLQDPSHALHATAPGAPANTRTSPTTQHSAARGATCALLDRVARPD